MSWISAPTVVPVATFQPLDFSATLGEGVDKWPRLGFEVQLDRGEAILDDDIIDDDILVEWSFELQILVSVDLDNDLAPWVQPSIQGDKPLQIAGGFRIFVSGAEVPIHQLGAGVSLLERENGTSLLTFTMPMRSEGRIVYDNPLGDFLDHLGPPPGPINDIDVDAIVVGDDGPITVRMLTEAMAEVSNEVVGPDGDTRTVSALGKHGRFDRRRVNLTLPPGHGLTMEGIAERILAEMEVEADLQGISELHRYKEFQAVDTFGWPLIQQLLAIKGLSLIWDRDGELVVRQNTRRFDPDGTDASADWVFETHDLLVQPGIISQPQVSGPTRVKITASEQILHDGDGSGIRTERELTEIFEFFRVPHATALLRPPSGSNPDCKITLEDFGSSPNQFQLVTRITYDRQFEGSTLLGENVSTEGWYNREKATFLQQGGVNSVDEDGPINPGAGGIKRCILSVLDGVGGPGRTGHFAVFREVEKEVLTREFNDDDYLIFERRRFFRYYNRRRSLGYIFVTISPPPSGPPISPIRPGDKRYRDNQALTFGSQGVEFAYEHLQHTASTQVTYDVDDEGFIHSHLTENFDEHVAPGVLRQGEEGNPNAYDIEFFYADGRTGRNATEFRQLKRSVRVVYSVRSDTEIQVTTTETDANGTPIRETVENLVGYLPAAEKKDVIVPDPDEFPDGVPASRHEQKQIEAEFISGELEAHREVWDETINNPYIENIDEAMEVAERIVRERSAVPVSFATMFNPLIRPGHVIRVKPGERSQPQFDCYVSEVTHLQEPVAGQSPRCLTTVNGKVYVV